MGHFCFCAAKTCGVEGAACAAPGGARRESLASDSAACACVGEPRPLSQIKRLVHATGRFCFCAAKSFTPLIISHPVASFVSPDKITRHVSNKCEFQVLFSTEMFTLKRNLQFLKKQETGTAGANNVFEGTRPLQAGRGRRAQAAPQRCEENPRDALRIRKVVQCHGHAGQSATTRDKVVQPGPARGHQMGQTRG